MQFWDPVQGVVVITPMCKRRPQGQAFNDENSQSTTTANAQHTSLQCPQRTSHPTSHCSDKQGIRPASAPIRPNAVRSMTWNTQAEYHLLLTMVGWMHRSAVGYLAN